MFQSFAWSLSRRFEKVFGKVGQTNGYRKPQKRSQNSERTLSFSALEDRRYLAGNVTAFMTGGTLNLSGDASDNQIIVEQVASGVFQVRPNPGFQTSLTRINGGTAPINFTAVKSLNLEMKQGNDIASVYSPNKNSFAPLQFVNGSLGIGNDEFYVSGTNWVSATLAGNTGADTIHVSTQFQIGQNAVIDGGDGADNLYASGSYFNLSFIGGDGQDTVTSTAGRVDNLSVVTDGGNDKAEIALSFGLSSSTINSVTAKMGDGNDTLIYTMVYPTTRVNSFIVRGGSGYDTLHKNRASYGVIVTSDIAGFESYLYS